MPLSDACYLCPGCTEATRAAAVGVRDAQTGRCACAPTDPVIGTSCAAAGPESADRRGADPTRVRPSTVPGCRHAPGSHLLVRRHPRTVSDVVSGGENPATPAAERAIRLAAAFTPGESLRRLPGRSCSRSRTFHAKRPHAGGDPEEMPCGSAFQGFAISDQ
jgi:hypothetical protein